MMRRAGKLSFPSPSGRGEGVERSATSGSDGHLWHCSRQEVEDIIVSPHLHPLPEGEETNGESFPEGEARDREEQHG
jgi:hypothetical protein